ncbi:DNA-dependent metalloprotease SPRTN isoform X1 [Sphaeramia orbicularis]|uniref:DNA-dependent metalloprotease SPRTN isoform X1 n=1 Tax=Sphaeramia orbicularis TaxID=375764 RepID=UPI0011803817|nr:sprT-like domain-containing protein Spartan isoform X1 [Sphaeramia orbicularis]
MDEDLLLAIQLQEQFDNEYQDSLLSPNGFQVDGFGQSSKKRKVEVAGGGGSDVVPYMQPQRPMSVVDESWEMLDPNPDVRAMFLEFNDTFFWGKLSGVEVKWSPRMTLCAGVCSYEGRGGLCSIRLSEPLLKLRPRKDLVQTLLHEMIHALLFVTQNNRDRDGHGPEFCKHMNRINKASGANITVFHSFHDEVDVYRQHWWRCDGPCQNRRPFFGYVKRAMNRAPSHLDPWWEDHRRTCGGTYTKIKEPEGYSKKGKTGEKKDKKTTSGNMKSSSTSKGSRSQDIRNIIPFSGKGFSLGGTSQTSTSSPPLVSVVKTSSSSPASPPQKVLPLSSPRNSLTSPVRSGLDDQTKCISSASPPVRPGNPSGQKPNMKKSVSNTRVFVNVTGSPVRISKANGAEKVKQRSIDELFNNSNLRKPSSSSNSDWMPTLSASSDFPRSTKPSPSKSTPSVVPPKSSPKKPQQSKYFSDSNSSNNTSGAAVRGQASRKRSWDDARSSASIFDFFQKTLSSNSAASRESINAKLPAMQQRTASASSSSASSPHSSAGQHGATSSSLSSSSSSAALMVSCPVCQVKVQESKINEHLDSCLS